MPFSSGPHTVNDSSVLFNYDIGDVTNSYKGEPTINLVTNASTFNGGWASYNNGNDGTFITEFVTTGYRIINRGSWNGIYMNFNLGSSGTYTFSAWFRYWGGSPNNNGATVYVNNYGSGDTATGLNKGIIGTWQRISHTVSVSSPSNVYFYIISYGGTYGADNSTWDVTMPQIELKSYSTAFVNGTRSSTQALLDLSGRNNIMTLVNMTYGPSNAISFDGTDDYINLPTNIQSGLTSATYEFVCRPTILPSGTYYQLYIQEANTWIALYNVSGITFFGIDLNNGSGWFDNNGGHNTGSRTTSTLSASTWYHVVFSWNGSLVYVYLNNTLQSTTSTLQAPNGRQNVTTLGAGTTNRNIGSRYNGGGNNWIGNISIVKFYNRNLSAAEIKNNYLAYKTRFNLP